MYTAHPYGIIKTKVVFVLIIGLIIAGVFAALGVLFSTGRGSFLIAGYNTSPKEEKAKTDVTALCKFMGKFMFTFAAILAVFFIGTELNIQFMIYAGIILMFICVTSAVVYMKTGNRFKK